MKKILLVLLLCLMGVCSAERVDAAETYIPNLRGTNYRYLAPISPQNFAAKFNENVTKNRFPKYMYMSGANYMSNNGKWYLSNVDNAQGDLDMQKKRIEVHLSADGNGYVNWVCIRGFIQGSIDEGAEEAMLYALQCCLDVITERYINDIEAVRAMDKFKLNAPYSQDTSVYSRTKRQILVFKRVWPKGLAHNVLIDIAAVQPYAKPSAGAPRS